MSAPASAPKTIPPQYLLPFILVTLLFPLWGFPNDFTNPLVAVCKDVFNTTNLKASMVQFAFYGGYATMAIPAALFIRRYSYKAGILLGLGLFALGAFCTLPAALARSFDLLLVALYVLTFGLAFLETTANPYILSMGPRSTATRRLNLAQAFNPVGSLTGMAVASLLVLPALKTEDFRAEVRTVQDNADAAALAQVDPQLRDYLAGVDASGTPRVAQGFETLVETTLADWKAGALQQWQGLDFEGMQNHDLKAVVTPYLGIAAVVLVVFVLFWLTKMPDTREDLREQDVSFAATLRRLGHNQRYWGGVIAQAFYVGAQIMCWTFIVQYATQNLGMDKATAQNWNIVAMGVFLCSRFICTFLLRFIDPCRLLAILAVGGIATILGVIFLEKSYLGLYCLIGTSACMSLMFPTIYGLALEGMGEDAKLASAGLIFAIIGGCLMPPMQGWIMDLGDGSGRLLGLLAVNVSFVLPLICFVVILVYGLLAYGGKLRGLPPGSGHDEEDNRPETAAGGNVANYV